MNIGNLIVAGATGWVLGEWLTMSYKNKTYVIFDGDKDIRYYRLMRAWKSNENINFNFHDAHDIGNISDRSSEENTKKKLRQRFSSAKKAIVLVGESTKNLYRFVRWEIEVAQNLGIPIIAANLNGKREIDSEFCPPILRDADALHVSFNQKIIRYALDNFEMNETKSKESNWYYPNKVYDSLGL